MMNNSNNVWDAFKQTLDNDRDIKLVDEVRIVVELYWAELAEFDQMLVDNVAKKKMILNEFDQWSKSYRGRLRKILAYFIQYRNTLTEHNPIEITPFTVAIKRKSSPFTSKSTR